MLSVRSNVSNAMNVSGTWASIAPKPPRLHGVRCLRPAWTEWTWPTERASQRNWRVPRILITLTLGRGDAMADRNLEDLLKALGSASAEGIITNRLQPRTADRGIKAGTESFFAHSATKHIGVSEGEFRLLLAHGATSGTVLTPPSNNPIPRCPECQQVGRLVKEGEIYVWKCTTSADHNPPDCCGYGHDFGQPCLDTGTAHFER